MLVPLGKRPANGDVVDLLLDCHERIRKFLNMARTLAAADNAAPEEVQIVAGQIERYFVESLPLHIADEQEQILPRIASWSPETDRALAQMTDDHTTHAPVVDRLTELCRALVRDPRQLATVAPELRRIAEELTAEMDRHLEIEERVIFPALRKLPAEQRDEILTAMRARRARVMH
jgi:hemerythrin-like domain-containing protein